MPENTKIVHFCGLPAENGMTQCLRWSLFRVHTYCQKNNLTNARKTIRDNLGMVSFCLVKSSQCSRPSTSADPHGN